MSSNTMSVGTVATGVLWLSPGNQRPGGTQNFAHLLLPSHQGLSSRSMSLPKWPSEREDYLVLSLISLPQLSLLTSLLLSLAFPGSRAQKSEFAPLKLLTHASILHFSLRSLCQKPFSCRDELHLFSGIRLPGQLWLTS